VDDGGGANCYDRVDVSVSGDALGRPAKPLITRERAARAALEVIDAQGLDSLNLELVARRMGVKAPSLYYHFSHKGELLIEVARLILVDVESPSLLGDWEQDLIRLCVAVRRSILEHPNAAPLLLQFFPRHLLLPAYEQAVADYTFPEAWHMVMIEGAEKLTFGSALFESSARARHIEPMPRFDPEKLPNLANAMRANPLNEEGLFVETLKSFIAGVRSRVGAGVRLERPAEAQLRVSAAVRDEKHDDAKV